MTIQIPNHSHCVICTRAVPHGEKTCSANCAESLEELNKKRKRSMMLMYALMGLAFVVLILTQMGIA